MSSGVATEIFVTVAHASTIIIHPIIDDMAVRMLLIQMARYDKLGVRDTQFLHIFQREFHHRFI